MRSINGMAERFRKLLEEPGGIELPGCFDVLSAMLLEQAKFQCVFVSGYGVSASFLGNPDIGLTTLSETAMIARHITNRVGIPTVIDADNGYGNEDNVLRTVGEFESAGAAAMIMEDQVLPKRCGHSENKAIVPLPHYLKKLEGALGGRQTPMVIVARTDASTVDEGILRAQAFHAAGADVTLIDGLRSVEDARRVAREVPGPKQINLIYGGKTPLLPSTEFHAMGFKIVLYSTPALYLSAQMLRQQLGILHETHDLNSISGASMPFQDFQKMMETTYLERARHGVPGST